MKFSKIEKIVLTTAVGVPALDTISTILTEEPIYQYIIPEMPAVAGVTITISLALYAFTHLLCKATSKPIRYDEPFVSENPRLDVYKDYLNRLNWFDFDEEKEY